MRLPNLEQYLRAFQLPPSRIFKDPALRGATVETNALGMPRVRSGNFALVFRLDAGTETYAVRCFTRTSKEVAQRYQAIAEATQALRVSTMPSAFLPFDYQAQGVSVEGEFFPIIKMKWAVGRSLGDYLSEHHQNRTKLAALRQSMKSLAGFLESHSIAHGDIQPGNVMVSEDAKQLQLVDYDGMYVPALSGLPAAELGHINFQHPKRSEAHFQAELDRFSFIAIDFALSVLEIEPGLWERSYSDEEGIVFRASDYANPLQSPVLALLAERPALRERVEQFSRICLGRFEDIPTLEEFQNAAIQTAQPAKAPTLIRPSAAPSTAPIPAKPAGGTEKAPAPKELPAIATSAPLVFRPVLRAEPTANTNPQETAAAYVGSYEVVSAASFVKVSQHVGKRIELVGKVIEVRSGKARFNNRPALRPYIYVDFNEMSSGRVVRIKLLPEVLETMRGSPEQLPNQSWVGKWLTVSEVVQPVQYLPHPAFSGGIGEASLLINQPGQIRRLSEAEARYRLASNNAAARARIKTRSVTTRAPRPGGASGSRKA